MRNGMPVVDPTFAARARLRRMMRVRDVLVPILFEETELARLLRMPHADVRRLVRRGFPSPPR